MESIGAFLTSKQVSNISYNFEQDTDLWPVLLSEYLSSQGKNSEALKSALVEDSPEWHQTVDRVKQVGFTSMMEYIKTKNAAWNVHLRHLLTDEGHMHLLRIYLRALVAQRAKRVADVGARAQTRQRINVTLAFLGNEAFISLNRLEIATEFVRTEKTEGGKDLGIDSFLFYTNMKTENQLQIANMIAMIILLKYATCTEDIEVLKTFIKKTAIRPIEHRLDALADRDKEQARHRLDLYYRLLEAVDIHF